MRNMVNDTFVTVLALAVCSKVGGGAAMKLIDWRSTVIRLSAVAISLGAWAGIVLVVRQLVG